MTNNQTKSSMLSITNGRDYSMLSILNARNIVSKFFDIHCVASTHRKTRFFEVKIITVFEGHNRPFCGKFPQKRNIVHCLFTHIQFCTDSVQNNIRENIYYIGGIGAKPMSNVARGGRFATKVCSLIISLLSSVFLGIKL